MDILAWIQKLQPRQSQILAASAVVIAAAVLLLAGSSSEPQIPALPVPQSYPAEQQNFYAEVTGYVYKPGVYELKESMLVLELLQLAGGVLPEADMQFIHRDVKLSAKVEPGFKLYVPAKSAQAETAVVNGKISINSASLEQLDSLTGIGPATAEKIIAARPFLAVEDLMNVPGIGEATFEKLSNEISL